MGGVVRSRSNRNVVLQPPRDACASETSKLELPELLDRTVSQYPFDCRSKELPLPGASVVDGTTVVETENLSGRVDPIEMIGDLPSKVKRDRDDTGLPFVPGA